MALKGQDLIRDLKKARERYLKVAHLDNPVAQFLLCSAYSTCFKYDSSSYIDNLQESADWGNPYGQFALGAWYFKKQDYTQAFHWFCKSAEQGYPEAQNAVGYLYLTGNGVRRNLKKAFEYYNQGADRWALRDCQSYGQPFYWQLHSDYAQWVCRAAKLGYAKAQYLAAIGDLGRRIDGAVQIEGVSYEEWFAKILQQGEGYAQALLEWSNAPLWLITKETQKELKWDCRPYIERHIRRRYEGNIAAKRDEKRLFKYLRKNMELGEQWYPRACVDYYLENASDLNDRKKAYEWAAMVDEDWQPGGRPYLGLSYLAGRIDLQGLSEDSFKKSWLSGQKESLEKLWGFKKIFKKVCQRFNEATEPKDYTQYRKDFGDQCIGKEYKRAFQWYIEAHEQGDLDAQYYLGTMYFLGVGFRQDTGKALQWYKKAAVHGDVRSQYQLALMYLRGEGVSKDYTLAAKWLLMAANEGYGRAQSDLAFLYQNGWGVEQNYESAFLWYQKAAQQENAFAKYSLGVLYYFGKGVPEDKAKAFDWLVAAYEQGEEQACLFLGTLYRYRLIFWNVLKVKSF